MSTTKTGLVKNILMNFLVSASSNGRFLIAVAMLISEDHAFVVEEECVRACACACTGEEVFVRVRGHVRALTLITRITPPPRVPTTAGVDVLSRTRRGG